MWQSWQVTPFAAAGESRYSENASSSRKPLSSVTSWHWPQKVELSRNVVLNTSPWILRPTSFGLAVTR